MLSPFLPPVPAVLLVDFDNVVSKIVAEFAESPLAWLRWLEAGGHEPNGRRRRLVMKRVYWNSHNEVYREAFEAAGFEAFACRSEAKSKKSTADMVLALDALDALYGEDRIREFILLSTDTDFVPLVDRLQEHDRRVVTLVDERDVSSAVYRARADLVITRNALGDAAQTPVEAYKRRLSLWGPVTVGPFPVHSKPPRKVRRARAKSEPAMALAADIVTRDMMGRRVRRMERERLPRLLARIEAFTIAGSEADRWLGWGTEEEFVEALAERNEALVVTRSRRGTPQLELSEQAQQQARTGDGPGFDLEGAAAEIARVAGERPGLMLNRARVTKLLSGFPTFTTSGARPFMGCATYRNFIRALVDLRGDLRLVPTPDGGVAVVFGVGASEPSQGEADAGAADAPVLLPRGAAVAKG
jgi:uncharacterized LabA/DUF88 family protein